MTPGAYVWRPNSAAEGSAVFEMFKLGMVLKAIISLVSLQLITTASIN